MANDYENFSDYCSSCDVEHDVVIGAIASGFFKSSKYLMGGVCNYFYHSKTTKEFAAEAFDKEFEKILKAIIRGENYIFHKWNIIKSLNSDRDRLNFLWLEAKALVSCFLDSPNQNINVVIDCLKANCSDGLPKEAYNFVRFILQHPRCNFEAVKYFIGNGDEKIEDIALKHRLSKKLSAFY
jgi:hypothetical protein